MTFSVIIGLHIIFLVKKAEIGLPAFFVSLAIINGTRL